MEHDEARTCTVTNCTFAPETGYEALWFAEEDFGQIHKSRENLRDLERKLADGAEPVAAELETTRREYDELVAKLRKGGGAKTGPMMFLIGPVTGKL